MFQTWPVKISRIAPNSTPSCRVGNSATMASITPGRKLSTGMDCRMSSTATIRPSMRLLYAAIVLIIAWAYVRFGTMPQAVGLLYGVKPVIIAVVLQALWGLGRTAIKSRLLAAIAIIGLAASMLDVNDMIVLLGGGIVMLAIRAFEDPSSARATIAAIPTVATRASGVKGAALAATVAAVERL